MNKKEAISTIASSLLKNFDNDTVHAAAEFLHSIETRRRRHEPDSTEISHQRKRLEQKIKEAFSDVTCYREVRVLLGGEAEDEYWPPDVQVLLSPLEERENWQNIPDDLLYACSCSLTYAGSHAYRFLIPRFMIGALHGVVEIYPGQKPNDEFIGFMCRQCEYLNEAQQSCLSDFLNLEVKEEGRYQRDVFLPWELDEYAASFAATTSYAEYGRLLIKRFCEREQI